MNRLLASSFVKWCALLMGGGAVNMAWLTAVSGEKVALLDAKEWFLVGIVYYLGALVSMAARALRKLDELEAA